MSAIHVATAANEVAQALPSTATVTVSKHGIQAVESLKLPAQSANQQQIIWSRTFSGMEILTNPTLHVMTESTSTAALDIVHYDDWLAVRDAIRPSSSPLGNCASNVNVTVNNASMAVTPTRDYRVVTTFYPEEKELSHQRHHYGLNQLDQYAHPKARQFQATNYDDVEKQHNANALRENYPLQFYRSSSSTGGFVRCKDGDWISYISIRANGDYSTNNLNAIITQGGKLWTIIDSANRSASANNTTHDIALPGFDPAKSYNVHFKRGTAYSTAEFVVDAGRALATVGSTAISNVTLKIGTGTAASAYPLTVSTTSQYIKVVGDFYTPYHTPTSGTTRCATTPLSTCVTLIVRSPSSPFDDGLKLLTLHKHLPWF